MRFVGRGWHKQIGRFETGADLALERFEPLFGIAAFRNFEDLGKLRQVKFPRRGGQGRERFMLVNFS